MANHKNNTLSKCSKFAKYKSDHYDRCFVVMARDKGKFLIEEYVSNLSSKFNVRFFDNIEKVRKVFYAGQDITEKTKFFYQEKSLEKEKEFLSLNKQPCSIHFFVEEFGVKFLNRMTLDYSLEFSLSGSHGVMIKFIKK